MCVEGQTKASFVRLFCDAGGCRGPYLLSWRAEVCLYAFFVVAVCFFVLCRLMIIIVCRRMFLFQNPL